MKGLIAFCVAVLVFVCAPVQTRWVKMPPANIPRPDGKPSTVTEQANLWPETELINSDFVKP